MKKFTLGALICIMALCLFACKDKEEKVEYNETEGVAEGKVELSGEDPKINISNIKAKVGTDIDYLSGVVIEDEEKFEDLKVWVDSTAVDIDEPGDYKAKYTFEYDGKSVEHYIVVTIVDDGEESAGDVENAANDNGGNGNAGNVGNGNGNAGNQVADNNNNVGNSNNNAETQTSAVNNNGNQGSQSATSGNASNNGGTNEQPSVNNDNKNTVAPTSSNKQDSTTKNPNTATSSVITQPSTSASQATTTNGGGSSSETTSRRQMVTTSGNATTEVKNIGYSYISLLSGSTVSIKSTTAKYILSTRTDVSYIEKNGVKYKVSKLIITYNTGDERTLETVEEKCN